MPVNNGQCQCGQTDMRDGLCEECAAAGTQVLDDRIIQLRADLAVATKAQARAATATDRVEELALVCKIVAQQAGAMDTMQRNGAALTPEDWHALRQGYTNAYVALKRGPCMKKDWARVGAALAEGAETATDARSKG